MSGVEVLLGGELLVRDPAHVRAVLTAVRRTITVHRRDGIGASPVVRELELAAVEALGRFDGSPVYRATAEGPGLADMSQYVTTAEAARMLGISERAVRFLCHGQTLLARRRKGKWLIPVEEVLARQANRASA